MSIFRRENEEPAAAPAPAPRVARTPNAAPTAQSPSRVAPGTRITGEISGAAELLIDGVVEGQVRVDSSVVVGSGGAVEGEIFARTVNVGGKVTGNVAGREKVEILASGVVQGDVRAPRVVIAEGAFLRGRVEMVDNVQEPRPKPQPPRQTKPKGAEPPGEPHRAERSEKPAPSSGSEVTSGTDVAAPAGPSGGNDLTRQVSH